MLLRDSCAGTRLFASPPALPRTNWLEEKAKESVTAAWRALSRQSNPAKWANSPFLDVLEALDAIHALSGMGGRVRGRTGGLRRWGERGRRRPDRHGDGAPCADPFAGLPPPR